MLNEADFIARCLDAMLAQDYLGELEFICIDGASDDATRAIVGDYASADPRVRLLDNPQRRTCPALNIGIRDARHELVLRMDAHSIADPDYIRQSVMLLLDTGAANVGGRWTFVGETYWQRAIASALSARFGAGVAGWRTMTVRGETDTVPFGCWRRETLLAIGGFEENLVGNEDYELNDRLRAQGGAIWFSPAIHVHYHVRRDLKALWRQYYRYGGWKVDVLRKRPGSLKARHLVAPAFVAGLALGTPLAIIAPGPVRWAFTAGVGTYAAATLVAATRSASRDGWELLPALPVVFLTTHMAWGAGFWRGLTRRAKLQASRPARPAR